MMPGARGRSDGEENREGAVGGRSDGVSDREGAVRGRSGGVGNRQRVGHLHFGLATEVDRLGAPLCGEVIFETHVIDLSGWENNDFGNINRRTEKALKTAQRSIPRIT